MATLRERLRATMTHEVHVEFDGSITVRKLTAGTLEQCKAVCRKYWNTGYNDADARMQLQIQDRATGRYISFML